MNWCPQLGSDLCTSEEISLGRLKCDNHYPACAHEFCRCISNDMALRRRANMAVIVGEGKMLFNDVMVSITDIWCHERHHVSNHLTKHQIRHKVYIIRE